MPKREQGETSNTTLDHYLIAGSAPDQLDAMARSWIAERMQQKGIKA